MRTVPIDPKLNVFIMKSAPDVQQFHAFSSLIENVEKLDKDMASPHIQALIGNVVSDEESDNEDNDDDEASIIITQPSVPVLQKHQDLPNCVFNVEPPGTIADPAHRVHIIPIEDEDIQAPTPQAKLLAWHYRLGHIPFRKIQQMAKRGDLPAALASCPIPKCAVHQPE